MDQECAFLPWRGLPTSQATPRPLPGHSQATPAHQLHPKILDPWSRTIPLMASKWHMSGAQAWDGPLPGPSQAILGPLLSHFQAPPRSIPGPFQATPWPLPGEIFWREGKSKGKIWLENCHRCPWQEKGSFDVGLQKIIIWRFQAEACHLHLTTFSRDPVDNGSVTLLRMVLYVDHQSLIAIISTSRPCRDKCIPVLDFTIFSLSRNVYLNINSKI